MTPRPPLEVTVPDCGVRSPVTSRKSVVLPAPLGPTSAAVVPSPTRNETSSSSTLPSGRAWLRCATSTYPTPVHLLLASHPPAWQNLPRAGRGQATHLSAPGTVAGTATAGTTPMAGTAATTAGPLELLPG